MIPPPEVAAALGIAPETPAIGRRRLMSLDGRPFEVAESWWPVNVAGGTAAAGPRRIKGGGVTLLAEMGYTVHRTVEDVWAAPEEEAGLLGIELGSPVLVMLRTAFSADGLAFQVDPAMCQANARQRYELAANRAKGQDKARRAAEHQKIAAFYRSLIMSGDLAPDEQPPSVAQLMKRRGVALHTIQRALNVLRDEGFTETRRGIGVLVRERALVVTEAIEYLALPNRLLDVGEVRPTADVAEAFGLERDATTAMRSHLLLSDGQPFELATSYLLA